MTKLKNARNAIYHGRQPVTSVGVGDAAEPEVAQQLAVPLRRPLPVVHRDDHVGLREGERGKMQQWQGMVDGAGLTSADILTRALTSPPCKSGVGQGSCWAGPDHSGDGRHLLLAASVLASTSKLSNSRLDSLSFSELCHRSPSPRFSPWPRRGVSGPGAPRTGATLPTHGRRNATFRSPSRTPR